MIFKNGRPRASRTVRQQRISGKEKVEGRRWIKRLVLIVVIITALSLLLVWMRVKTVQLGYVITELRKETIDLSQKINKLRSDVAKLQAPGRLEEFAKTQLKMRPPKENEIIFIKQMQEGGAVVPEPNKAMPAQEQNGSAEGEVKKP